MNNLFLVNETFTNGYLANILNVISLFAVLCGVFVIISKNPVVSVLFLIGLFGNVASYLILIGLGFMGLAYLVVYIGAISILFLFILMLINIRISELQSNTRNTISLAITITIALNYPLFNLLPYDVAILSNNLNDFFFYLYINKYNPNYINNLNAPTSLMDKSGEHISFVTSNMWDGNLAENGHITSIGSVLYTNYNMWLLIASLILLLAMVGCIVITLKTPTDRNTGECSNLIRHNTNNEMLVSFIFEDFLVLTERVKDVLGVFFIYPKTHTSQLMYLLYSGNPDQILGQYRNLIIDLDEYSLRLDNLMSNLQKLYKTGGPAEERISRSILFQLDLLLELHNDLQLCFSDIHGEVLFLDDTKLISGIR